MAQKILMPALSPTMTEGTLAKWLIAEGDSVQPGDIIAEIETDKAAMEVESIDEGVLSKILVPAGSDNIAVNTLIAVLKEKGDTDDDVAALLQGGVPLAAQSETPSQPTKELVPEAEPVQNAVPAAPIATHSTDERLFASPLAKRMAKDAGISLAAIKGSGPHGRIIKADVEHAKANPELLVSAPGDAASPASMGFVSSLRDPAHGYVPPFELTAHNNMRKTIAKRLQESKQSIPHFYLRVACQIDALLALRQEINARLVDEKISVNDMVLRAVALALNAEPDANASWGDDGQYSGIP
ncbi:MAG: 2-oxo acid dehydrogenase subunit E2, partial [Pseudomonadota bacterium]